MSRRVGDLKNVSCSSGNDDNKRNNIVFGGYKFNICTYLKAKYFGQIIFFFAFFFSKVRDKLMIVANCKSAAHGSRMYMRQALYLATLTRDSLTSTIPSPAAIDYRIRESRIFG